MRTGVALALIVVAVGVRDVAAQDLPRAHHPWRTVETDHFEVHYPEALAAWTLPLVARLEAVHEAVSALVGSVPEKRTTVVVDDPSNVSNGFAFTTPLIVLWPTPPEPRSLIGHNREWSEGLAVHEYVHVAHLTRPPRNSRERWLWRLIPVPVYPIAAKTPRWAIEGYATYLEGKITGSGRPHGTWRAAVLRQWALEGKLPSYRGMSRRSGGFLQGSMAYLVGSAFLEWLVEEHGEESLPNLWRRLTARRRRGFDRAFSGVFGGPPAELYGRFTAELTGRALAVEETITGAGVEEGVPFQRLDGVSLDLTVSPDGRHMALVRRPEDGPQSIVVWTTEPESLTSRQLERRERARELDPEDVPAIEWRPRAKRTVARLRPVGGRGHVAPRFLPDGDRLLVVRWEGTGDGRARPDLYEWTFGTGRLRRITRGESIRWADPDPGGGTAVGSRCVSGVCDVVRIDLETGAVTTIARGTSESSYYRPRTSPDGGRIVASRQFGSRWRLVEISGEDGGSRPIDPDDGATRFDAEFLENGSEIVAVSDRGGVHQLERLALETGVATPITRVTGAALSPTRDSAAGSIFFLALRSRGFDLHRLEPAPEGVGELPLLEANLGPVARIPDAPGKRFAPAEIPVPRPYGAGPRSHVVLPVVFTAPEGWGVGGGIASGDPIGRLGWVVQGSIGEESAWRGGSAAAVWRGFRPWVRAEGFWTRHRPSKQDDLSPTGLDAEYAGGAVSVELVRDFLSRRVRYRLGGSVGRLIGDAFDGDTRRLAFAEVAATYLQTPGRWRVTPSVRLHGAIGETTGEGWNRFVGTAGIGVGRGGRALRAEIVYGTTGGDRPAYEWFAVGGMEPPLTDPALHSQRLAMPALPVGFDVGRDVFVWKVELGTGAGLSPFYWSASAGDAFGRWRRVIGVDASVDALPFPFLGLPGVRVRYGIARSIDVPFKDETRFYARLSYKP